MIEQQIEAKNFIAGEWVSSDSGELEDVVNPTKPSEVLGTTPKSSEAEAGCAVEAAAEALSG